MYTMAPKVILLFSGKRKSGKDFLTDHLKIIFKDGCEIIKISEPIKTHWAKEKNLDLNALMSPGGYKEQYRLEMIKWSDDVRERDYGYFCREACLSATDRPIWIVSDVRRKTDLRWFKETYKDLIKTIRITADEETRKSRGYKFADGIDNVASECDLDDYEEWDLVVNNGVGRQQLEDQIKSITDLLPSL